MSEPNRSSNDLLKRQDDREDGWTDAFGKQVASTTNEADIAGHYPFSPERWRLFKNGTRQFIQYGSVPEYTDSVDTHDITPQSSGDVLRIETAERYRYVVGYVIEWSAALSINQTLQSGEAVTLGYGNADLENSTDDFPGPSADGWFLHWHSGLESDQVRLCQYRNGSAVSENVVTTEKQATDWIRYAAETNWYNVGETSYVETYTDGSSNQVNHELGKVAPPDNKGPENANKSISISIKATSGAGSLTAEVGSVALRTLGSVTPIQRQKTHMWGGTTASTAGNWSPIHAFRVDPDRTIVSTQITNTDITKVSSTSADVQAIVLAVDPTKTDASTWTTPNAHSEINSVLEVAGSVTTAPDSTGTATASMTNPGGYQIGYTSWYSTGAGSKTTIASGSATRKRNLSHGDVGIILAKSTEASVDVSGELISSQEW